jgi:hypothetical protein
MFRTREAESNSRLWRNVLCEACGTAEANLDVHYSIDKTYMGLLMRKLHRAVKASWKATQGMLLDIDTGLNNGCVTLRLSRGCDETLRRIEQEWRTPKPTTTAADGRPHVQCNFPCMAKSENWCSSSVSHAHTC